MYICIYTYIHMYIYIYIHASLNPYVLGVPGAIASPSGIGPIRLRYELGMKVHNVDAFGLILGLYWNNGNEIGNYYLGFRA